MKSLFIKYCTLATLLIPCVTSAETPSTDIEILAQRGKGQVTQTEFSARADKIPANIRFGTLRDTTRLRNVLNTMLLRAQLAADASEAGFDQTEMVKNRMQLAAKTELADAWLQHYVEQQPAGNYEQLAREYYELNKQNMMSPSKMDVSHILVSTDERSSEEASELAESISEEAKENPESFEEMILAYSEDPSVKANQGRFFGVSQGEMVKPFEDVAFALAKGEISDPVKTKYGFHIIRLDEMYAPESMSFDQVRDQLMDSEQKKHEERIKQEYLSSLSSLDVLMSEEGLEEMVSRQFGESSSGNGESE